MMDCYSSWSRFWAGVIKMGPLVWLCMVSLCMVPLLSCTAVMRVGMEIVTDEVPPAPRSFEDLAYRLDPDADQEKHRLDLFLPSGATPGFPMLVFVHGGGFDRGDKDHEVGGVLVYDNVGRFFAHRGIGVAVISYRLQPSVDWSAQLDDVARAVAWVHQSAPGYGASPTLVLAGHSAGAWLVARLAVDDAVRGEHGLGAETIDGVIAISGGGYDLADPPTWTLDADVDVKWFEARLRLGDDDRDWQRNASVIPLIDGDVPPFLLLHSRDEWASLARQNLLLRNALRAAGSEVSLVAIEGGSHARMVLRLAREETVDSGLVEDFVKNIDSR